MRAEAGRQAEGMCGPKRALSPRPCPRGAGPEQSLLRSLWVCCSGEVGPEGPHTHIPPSLESHPLSSLDIQGQYYPLRWSQAEATHPAFQLLSRVWDGRGSPLWESEAQSGPQAGGPKGQEEAEGRRLSCLSLVPSFPSPKPPLTFWVCRFFLSGAEPGSQPGRQEVWGRGAGSSVCGEGCRAAPPTF